MFFLIFQVDFELKQLQKTDAVIIRKQCRIITMFDF